jgi:hypothetical protein
MSNILGIFTMARAQPTPVFLVIQPEELKKGWTEMHGVTPIHHEYKIIQRLPSWNYLVCSPESELKMKHG